MSTDYYNSYSFAEFGVLGSIGCVEVHFKFRVIFYAARTDVNQQIGFFGAQVLCQENGLQIASVESQTKLNAINEIMDSAGLKNEPVWVGVISETLNSSTESFLNLNANASNDFIHSKVGKKPWAPNEPDFDSGATSCVTRGPNGLEDHQCTGDFDVVFVACDTGCLLEDEPTSKFKQWIIGYCLWHNYGNISNGFDCSNGFADC